MFNWQLSWEYVFYLFSFNIFGPVRSCSDLQHFWPAGPNVLLTFSHFTITEITLYINSYISQFRHYKDILTSSDYFAVKKTKMYISM